MAKQPRYKTLLLDARNLRTEAGRNAWKRAKLLTQVFDDREFRAEVGALDDFATAGFLDAEVEDLCVTFLQLREMLRAFPDEAAWTDGKLRTLYERTRKAGLDAEQAEAAVAVKTRRTVTIKEFEKAEQQKQEAEAALRHKDREVAKIVTELDQLRAENQTLRLENASLRGRIEQMERTLADVR